MYQSGTKNFGNSPKLLQKLNRAIEVLKSKFDVKEVYVFGSVARGEIEKGSAADLLVIAETDIPFIERLEEVNDAFGQEHIRAEVVIYTPEEFRVKRDCNDPFVEDAMEEAIKIYPEDESTSENPV